MVESKNRKAKKVVKADTRFYFESELTKTQTKTELGGRELN